MILRATYRPAGQTDAPTRVEDIEAATYDDAYEMATAGKGAGEHLIHVRRP